ncbi:MAG: protein phosphatase 2C domain-containing protein, partial [Bdellovibrionales bacterium]|nr:protein phosphatase 2C domain-containing protein [Bdellovibrionales bacterium]
MNNSPRIECFSFRGKDKSLESSNYVLFNPTSKPGTAVLAGSCAAHESIGSQVACRLALEHFSTSLLQYFDHEGADLTGDEFGLQALEAAFREANRNVYSFGHSLAAGGRMAAVFVALIYLVDDKGNGSFCVGRVGNGSAYLFRDGELFPFFEQSSGDSDPNTGNFLGANSLVSVDLANVPVEASDRVFLFSEPLDAMGEHELHALADEIR